MQLVLTAEEAAVHRVVGTTTFLQGRHYAIQGAVMRLQWRDKQVFGEVRGSARHPYTTFARMVTSPAGALTSFLSSCTCPAATNCKHGVALLLAAIGTGPGTDGPTGEPPQAPWESSFSALIGGGAPVAAGLEMAGIGLQFELCEQPPADGRAAFRIGLRPVLPGRSDNWVRTGITWSNLSYARYAHPNVAPSHLALLGEIMALSASGSIGSYYGYRDAVIYLDQITSRRIWDLFEEARAIGLPLVQAGRQSGPVRLARSRAEVSLLLHRSAAGLDAVPALTVDGEQVLAGASLLLGSPAHGLAWWQTPDEPEPLPKDRRLRLAALATPIDSDLRELILGGGVQIPERDEDRFLREYYPALRQRLTLVAGDQSVVLPEPAPPRLTVEVVHEEEHRAVVGWAWGYGEQDGAAHEPLYPEAARPGWRDVAAEAEILRAVTPLAVAVPDLVEQAEDGVRLVSTGVLTGMATVRFATQVLPRLLELPDVEVTVRGVPATYRESDAAPVVGIAGHQNPDERDWFDLAVTVSIDGEDVPFQQLFVALAAEEPYLVLPSGTYFSLDRAELHQLAELIAEARALQDAPGESVRVSRFQASLWEDLQRLGVISGQAAAWQQAVSALAGVTEMVEHPVPAGLLATLRPYQQQGFNWLAFLFANRLGGVLADDMGLGKTLQALALMSHVREETPDAGPFLVVAPTSVVSNWAAECQKFTPGLSVTAISETQARRGTPLAEQVGGADVVLTSYTLFRLEYDQYAALDWAGLVLDEAQFVKNHNAQAYQCAKKLPAPFKLAITGTPMENNLMELWSLLSITSPGLFSSPARFEQYYRTPIEKGKDAALLAQLRRRIRPLMLRRTKTQVLTELPDKQEQVIELELNPRHAKVYQTHLQRERQKVLGLLGNLDKNRFEIFRSLTLLRQASLHAGLIDPKYGKVPSTKLDALMQHLDDIVADGHRTLVFSQFTRFLDAARQRLEAAGIEYCYLDGKTRKRAAVLDSFKSGTAPVFLVSLKAGGFGLNLTEADYCILLDPWWNPATEAQAVDRVHRIGQTRKVMVYRLVAKGTIEEKVMALKAAKAALFSSVMDDGGFESGVLTAADIRGLLE